MLLAAKFLLLYNHTISLYSSLIQETVVLIVDDFKQVPRIEEILRRNGINQFKCYLDGMKNWTKIGGILEFPRFIRFKVSM